MSTIDRLMGRLGGHPLSEVAEAPVGGVGPGQEGVAADVSTEARPADPVAAVNGAPLERTPATHAPPAALQVGETVTGGQRPRHDPRRLLELDLERLASRGHLVPGRGTDTMSEQYQQIKRRLVGSMNDPNSDFDAPPNLVMITSSVPNEGKTFTSVNLALSLAMELERTVLAVDTDVIKQDMSRTFGATGRPGLFDYLSREDVTLPDVICSTNVPKLALVPAGTERTTITERLASDAMRRLTLELAQRYADRIVLFDCPPVLATTGATALAPYIGQIVMVVEAGRTTRDTLLHALQMLDHVRVTGLILNKVKETMTDGYQYYGRRYGYLSPQGRE